MKDQSFKRYFPSNHAKQRQSYKYPTYKHYYEPKNYQTSEVLDESHNYQNQAGTKKTTVEEKKYATFSHQSNRNNLKTELENLKLQVHKIMQQKQNVLRNSIQKKFFPEYQVNKKDSPQLQNDKEYSDNQSIDSEQLSKQQSQISSVKPSSQNYDQTKHLQIQNNLLKTELKGLRSKYENKKREMKVKCDELENKVQQLENSHEKSSQQLKAEISNLKSALQEAKKSQLALELQNSKKQQEALKTAKTVSDNEAEQSELFAEKINQLNKELSAKNKTIQEQLIQLTRLSNNLIQNQKNDQEYKQRIQQMIAEKEQNQKAILEEVYKKLKKSEDRVKQLQDQIDKLQNDNALNQQNQFSKGNLTQMQSKFDLAKKEYEYKLQEAKSEIQQLKSEISSINNAKRLMQEEIKYLHSQKKLNEEKIESLNDKIQSKKTSCQEMEEIYKVNLQAKQRQYQQLLKNIETQYQKKSKLGSSQKISGNQDNKRVGSLKEMIGEDSILQRQVKKWKIQYKLLKQRYQSHVIRENKNKNEFQEYYSTYRQSKNKLEIYTHKINILQKQLQNYMNLLTGKQNELIKKQIEIRRLQNQQTLQKNKSAYQISTLTEKYKYLQEKYNEEVQKNQKEVAYRKQIQQKLSSLSQTNDSTLNEVIERMKRRLIQQDEKMNKNVKELKSKDALNSKLKQQLREVIQNLQKKMNSQKNQEIKQILEECTRRETQSLANWKEKSQKQQQILEESNKKLLAQILTFKNCLNEKDLQVMAAQNQVKQIKSAYNMKCLQVSDTLQQKQLLIQQYIQQLEEADILKEHVQNVLNEQIQRKNDQINSLREQLLLKITKNETYSKHNPSFDEILKSHMETSTKLRDDVNKKTEEIFRLRDNYSTLRSQYQNLKSQIDISKLKMLSQKKNIEVNYQIQIQNLKNEIAGEEKKIASLQQKIKVVIEQNKKKDSFIQTYIMGKKLPQNEKELVTAFIKKYEITLGSPDIVERLQFDIKQIQKLNVYNDNLLKQVSVLKEKLLLFEAIDQQKLSLSQSKFSKCEQNNIKEEPFEDVNLRKENRVKIQKSESLNVHVLGQKQEQ